MMLPNNFKYKEMEYTSEQKKLIKELQDRTDTLQDTCINLEERINKAIEITKQLLMNSADNRMIADEFEKDYFDWLDRTLIKQLEILKGDSNE